MSIDSEILSALQRQEHLLEDRIENLEASFSRIDISDNISIMANNGEQSLSIKIALESIPRFDGTNVAVREFVRACKTSRKLIPNFNENLFIQLIITKLTGNASTVFGDREVTSLDQLYNDLALLFGDTKSIPTLQAELSTIKQTSDETVGSFACRVIELLNRLEERVKTENEKAVGDVLLIYFKQTAIKSFMRGLKRDLESRLATTSPKSIQEAVELARQAELEIREINQIHGYRSYSSNNYAAKVQNPVTCNYCGKTNHKEEDCFKKKNAQRSQDAENSNVQNKRENEVRPNRSEANNTFCRYCKKTGHLINDCRKRQHAETRRVQGNLQPSNSEN